MKSNLMHWAVILSSVTYNLHCIKVKVKVYSIILTSLMVAMEIIGDHCLIHETENI